MFRRLFLLAIVALTACRDERPPQPTSAEAGQLNEAEDMLNAMGEKEGAAPTGTAPPMNRD
jgi:hypothetical protein